MIGWICAAVAVVVGAVIVWAWRTNRSPAARRKVAMAAQETVHGVIDVLRAAGHAANSHALASESTDAAAAHALPGREWLVELRFETLTTARRSLHRQLAMVRRFCGDDAAAPVERLLELVVQIHDEYPRPAGSRPETGAFDTPAQAEQRALVREALKPGGMNKLLLRALQLANDATAKLSAFHA